MPRLEVKVGPDRFHMEACRVNDFMHPHEINTEHFVGRVLVRIRDYPGARPGEPGYEYFVDRTRKFCIQIEGRFKQEWDGDDILFGTDFDMFVPFPRAPFNAGMHVARLIDPCTFYEEHPPSGRPYIMSPYAACMNAFCAWPTPKRMPDAVIVWHPTSADNAPMPKPQVLDGNEVDIVPMERLEHKQDTQEQKHGWFSSIASRFSHEERVTESYWRFVGFRSDKRVLAMLDTHEAEALLQPSVPASAPIKIVPAPVAPKPMRPAAMNTGPATSADADADASTRIFAPIPVRTGTPSVGSRVASKTTRMWHGIDKSMLTSLGSSSKPVGTVAKKHLARPDTPALPNFTESTVHADNWSDPILRNEHAEAVSEKMQRMHLEPPRRSNTMSADIEHMLGPWRFTDPATDMIEDNAFVFINESVSVPRRRKHFASVQSRLDFKYDPDVVYGASFFSNLMDFNTFDLSIGPVRINLQPFFRKMPIR
ncbi:hypothetical protein MVES_001070 [Malassezia vespertilionis]|uniref:Domain of unknown function at the cortex 1 domain-containing protein n=2 Tax=Malassezia vespertilionis TaxID=2020962 RepID=A0A2N1JEF8_9BASI|nr:hypothetical protein MVES_001070 [Malassezia vespertilionis]